jgi:hypothetical protein
VRIWTRTAVTVAIVLLVGCSPVTPPERTLGTGVAFPPVLNVDVRGNPPLTVEIGTVEAARLACSSGAIVTPGEGGIPALPWDIRVVSQVDGRVLLADRITELPKWLIVFGNEAALGSTPVAGPYVPCASGM